MEDEYIVDIVIGWIFGLIVLGIGMINIFWGEDLGFGIFISLLSFVYFPPSSRLMNKITQQWLGYKIPKFLKILLGMFIFWATVGVGELFDKIELMINSF